MSKVYPSSAGAKLAVKTTSLGIPRGQCFGLLGINGAGKSSLLSILSGKSGTSVPLLTWRWVGGEAAHCTRGLKQVEQ